MKTFTECEPLQRYSLSGPTMGSRFSAVFYATAGLDTRPIQAELQAAIAALGIGFTTLVQDPGPRLGIEPLRALPVTLLVDPAGQVRETLVGEQTADGLRARLRALGAAPGS